jgi:hypothetical protein
MRLPFHMALKRLVVEAFVPYAAAPEQVVQRLQAAVHRPCGKHESQLLRRWLEQRRIRKLVHFTPLQNVRSIIRYGLIPREYLELDVVQMVLGPRFTDGRRRDGLPHFSCLSITSPNYRMFWWKRKSIGGRWAVVEFDPRVLTRLYFAFAPTNAASGCESRPGVPGAERLFALPELRRNLGLTSAEPTDPQSEALCDSIVGAKDITAVYVENVTDAELLLREGIAATVNAEPFGPRRDFRFWRERSIGAVVEDGGHLAEELGGG